MTNFLLSSVYNFFNYELSKKKYFVKNWFYKIFYFNSWKFQNIIFITKCKKKIKIILNYKNIYKKLTLGSKNYKIKILISYLERQNYQTIFFLLDFNTQNITNHKPISLLLFSAPSKKIWLFQNSEFSFSKPT